MNYRNVIFDIGNVVVIWSPVEIVKRTFGQSCDPEKLVQQLFHNDIWKQLNLGKLSEQEAKVAYREELGFKNDDINAFFVNVKETQNPVGGTVELMESLRTAGYQLFALSDNVNEIVTYLKKRYDFWKHFIGAVISSEVQAVKPHPEIFELLSRKYNLDPAESIFIDDYSPNTQGARDVGFATVDFKSAEQCRRELRSLGLRF